MRKLLLCGLVTAITALPLVPANAARAVNSGELAVAWQVASPNNTSFHAPAITPYGVAATFGSTVTMRGLAHGTLVWSKLLPQSPTDEPGVRYRAGDPVSADNTVDLLVYGYGIEGIADFDAANGKHTVHDAAFHTFYSKLAVSGTRTARVTGYFGSNEPVTYLLDWGGRTWFVAFDFNYGPAPLPTIIGSRVFVPANGGLEGFDPNAPCHHLPVSNPPDWCIATWRTTFAQPVATPVAAGTDLIATADASGTVTWLTARTGLDVALPASLNPSLGPLTSANGVVYVGGTNGTLYALAAPGASGGWSGNAGAPIRTAPTVSNGHVFVATDNGRLVEFNAAGCGHATCAPVAVGNAKLAGTQASGRPVVRNHVAVVAYGTHLVAFSIS